MEHDLPVGLTFDDVLLVPGCSEVHPNLSLIHI
jgi:IMP dehydrogenase/GMP reductase